MKNINQLKSAPKKLSSISKDIRTYSTLQNVDNVKQQLEQTKRATYKFTFFIVLLVFLVLYVIFNIIYKQRTYEFGILKCIGFSNKDVFKIITAYSVKIGTLYALLGTIITVVSYFMLISLLRLVLLCYVLTFLAVLPTFAKIAKIDPIDVITESRTADL